MSATLDIRAMPGLGERVRRVTVDCEHGTTTVHQFDGKTFALPDAALVCLALGKHDEEERCNCTAALWRRYGPAEAA